MALISDIQTTVARNIGLAELGVRGGLRVSQTFTKVAPRVLRWGLRRKRPSPAELRELFEALGATYIKFGQFIASSPSLFPKEYVDEFEKLLDQAPPLPFHVIEKIMAEELKRPLTDIYRFIDPNPLACASIAQVHAATLTSGEDVVVKVQKPGVQAVITVDLNTVYLLVRLLELMLPNTDRDALAGIVAEMYQAMIDECDFVKEASHIEGFTDFLNARGIETVIAPKVYPQGCSARVLTMERFYGCSLTDIKALEHDQADPVAALFEALNVWFASLTGCEFFHADLHSGNMLLLDDGRVAFIDFGMVGRVTPQTWQAVFSLLKGLTQLDYPLVARSMLAIGMTRENINELRLAADIKEVFRALEDVQVEGMLFGAPGPGNSGVDAVVSSLTEVARNHGIRFPRSFTLLLKQFLYFDRYLQLLDPGADLFNDGRLTIES